MTFYGELRARGEWTVEPKAMYWEFIFSDTTKIGIYYALFLIFKRLYMSATLHLSDGAVNAILSMASQTVDSLLLFFLRPFSDRQATSLEVLAGVSNLMAYCCLGLPVLLGPAAYIGFICVVHFHSAHGDSVLASSC